MNLYREEVEPYHFSHDPYEMQKLIFDLLDHLKLTPIRLTDDYNQLFGFEFEEKDDDETNN